MGGLLLGLFEDAEYERRASPASVPATRCCSTATASPRRSTRAGTSSARTGCETVWQTCCPLPSVDVIEHLLDEVETFRGSAVQSDDMTAVVVGPRRQR